MSADQALPCAVTMRQHIVPTKHGRRLRTCLAAALVACCSFNARAQDLAPDSARDFSATQAAPLPHDSALVRPGDTVRLFEGDRELVCGVLVSADSGTVRVIARGSKIEFEFDRARIGRADVRRGARRRGGRAVMTGFRAGLAVGALFTAIGATQSSSTEGMGVFLGLAAAGVSTIVGVTAGGVAAFTFTDNWVPFEVRLL